MPNTQTAKPVPRFEQLARTAEDHIATVQRSIRRLRESAPTNGQYHDLERAIWLLDAASDYLDGATLHFPGPRESALQPASKITETRRANLEKARRKRWPKKPTK